MLMIIFSIISKILSFVASVVKFFLFKLFMWVPVTFVVGYFILAAVMGWEEGFFGEPQRTILIAGAIILATIALTLAITLKFVRGRKLIDRDDRDRDRDYRPLPPRYDDRERERYYRDDYYRDDYRERDKAYYDMRELDARPPVANKKYDWDTESKFMNYSDYSEGVQESFDTVENSATATLNGDKDYSSPAPSYNARETRQNTTFPSRRRITNLQEKPLVYATRKDPDILILEYSDKISYFRKNKAGGEPVFICEELKE